MPCLDHPSKSRALQPLPVATRACHGPGTARWVAIGSLDPLFAAVVQAVGSALVNSLIANRNMTCRDGHFVPALPQGALLALLRTGSGQA